MKPRSDNYYTMNEVHKKLNSVNTYARNYNLVKINPRKSNHLAHSLIMKHHLY